LSPVAVAVAVVELGLVAVVLAKLLV